MDDPIALIIEDHLEIAEMYAIALQMLKYQTEIVLYGQTALERLGGIVPDIVILDMNLPSVSGHYIYKQMRASARFDNTPIIISTANAVVADVLGNDLTPSDRLLIKPISPRTLQEVAREIG